MAKVLAITNQKGGVGKTTTAVNLAACLGALGRRVLLVDFDPQGNATSGVGLDKAAQERTAYQVIVNAEDVRTAICHTDYDLDVIPANVDLAGAEVELATAGDGRETRLKAAVDQVRDDYDFILIDSPPSLGLLSLNALTAADGVLIPIQCEFYALEGVSELMRTLDLVREGLNPSLEVSGVLLTMFDARTNLSGQVAGEVREFFKEKVYETVIPRTVRLSEAPSYGMPIIAYDIHAKGAEVYAELAKEVDARG
ncbi:MAG: ParA family protein [Schwartzia sp.]|nr:ParA family protein [Schwartzia sp. (in: firmicutes)]